MHDLVNQKKRLFLSGVFACFLTCLICISIVASGCEAGPSHEYGVFLGIGGGEADRLKDYSLAVIEPSEFEAVQIREFHEAGKTIYGYINIGAVEEYRPYYERFKDTTLSVYESWPLERWTDVSDPEWQAFVVDELAKQYADIGVDGFFLDNADVYFHYPTENIFQGLCSILKGLKGYDLPLIVNGGDDFVSRCMYEEIALSLFDGINQETVFTAIAFENESYGKQKEEETLYFKDYLTRAKDCGLSVYLLEYGADPALSKEIDDYCRGNDFFWYNAQALELR